MKYLVFLTIFPLCGCTMAKIVKSPGTSNLAYAPVNESSLPGTVKYNANGLQKSRRENAYKKMSDACQGKYKIIKETTLSEGSSGGTMYYPVGSMVGSNNIDTDYQEHYIDFECVK